MPKLLQRNLWKWMINMIVIAVAFEVILAMFYLVIGQEQENNIFFGYPGVMLIPYIYFLYGQNIPFMNENFYIAPYCYEERKAILKKYFRLHLLSIYTLTLIWYLLACCFTAAMGFSFHPLKIVYALIVQLCLIYDIHFINYYRPRLRFAILTVCSLFLGGGIMTGMLKDWSPSLGDYIIMAVIGTICVIPAIVLRVKYFEKMIDCHSSYEKSRQIAHGLIAARKTN